MDVTVPLTLRVLCGHCSTVNRVPENRLEESPKCGACKQLLFDGHPVEVTGAELERHLARSDLPVVVDFWAPWCAPCRAMAPIFERIAQQVEPQARFIKLNTDKDQAIASRFDIRSIPTLVIVKQGKEVARRAGAMDARRFQEWVEGSI